MRDVGAGVPFGSGVPPPKHTTRKPRRVRRTDRRGRVAARERRLGAKRRGPKRGNPAHGYPRVSGQGASGRHSVCPCPGAGWPTAPNRRPTAPRNWAAKSGPSRRRSTPARAARPAASKSAATSTRSGRRRRVARQASGHGPDRRTRQADRPPLHRGGARFEREIYLGTCARPEVRARDARGPPAPAAWRSRRSPGRSPPASCGSASIRPSGWRRPGARGSLRPRPHGRPGRPDERDPARLLSRLHGARRHHGGDQSAGRHDRRASRRARRQDELRRQRAVPPSEHLGIPRQEPGGPARARRRRPRSQLCRSGWRTSAVHRQRRRPRHGHHGHDRARGRRTRELSRHRRRREPPSASRRPSTWSCRMRRSRPFWSTSSPGSTAATGSPRASCRRSGSST